MGQAVDFSAAREILGLITSVCLAYIMIEVGLEFSAEGKKISSYGWDTVVAFTAAVLPAIFWLLYFLAIVKSSWQPALLSGLSCAPTSAGVLFAMLMAAGLSATWVFKKARTLAVLDDLVTILLLTPLSIIIHGFEWESIAVLILIVGLLFASFRWKHSIRWPTGETWLLGYAFALTGIILLIKKATNIHLEVLIPAFTWGCLMKLSRHDYVDTSETKKLSVDVIAKGAFMFLVGISFPKVAMGSISLGATAGHILMLTLLANLGKCFPVLCYRNEASIKERWALGVAMFPRGEVGAAVLLIAVGYGLGGYEVTLAMLSLAFNLVLTGIFVWIVLKLLNKTSF